MDRLITRFKGVDDGDLKLCHARGVAYQRSTDRVSYDESYFDKCAGYEGAAIAKRINEGRINFVNEFVGAAQLVDVGIGSGEFIKLRGNACGRDVNSKAEAWLKQRGLWADDLSQYKVFTFWDVIEHIENPDIYFRQIPDNAFVFACLPVFDDLNRIRESKHYRPGEHLYYWTEQGFIDWMEMYRFRLLDKRRFETEAGRENITSFAFARNLPGYHETLEQYKKLHAPAYGTSAWLHFDLIAKEVLALNPKSIIDYGCGRSDLAAHFWNDGKRQIVKYDPAIPQYQTMPEGRFDLALVCDVMEHILMVDVDRIFAEVKAKADRAIFTISLRPARARLPDGRNAHVTLLKGSEWASWIKSVFGAAAVIPTQWDHELMVRTW